MQLNILTVATLVSVAQAIGIKADANNIKQYRRSTIPSSNVLSFENFGYSGTYSQVSALNNPDSDSCTCEVSSTPVKFSGVNAPINEPVSVHFRGPLVLNKFAVYTSPDFAHGDDLSGNWTRTAYYDASSAALENVTFLTTAGANSTCLGQALTYAGSDGVSKASSNTALAANTTLDSNAEYSIFSNVTCQDSGLSNDCGVYRAGIPAYHGFGGTIKTFLFQFTMPNDTSSNTDISNFNMPAIWLLNAQIPRTSQYNNNVNCSCWRSGCGEFDIFEVKNYTESLVGELYTTIHDYQGTGDIESGLSIDGFIPRNYESTYTGGVTFDKDGNAIVFVSNSTTFGEEISAASLNSWVSKAGTSVNDKLSSVAASSSTSSSKKGDAASVGIKSMFGAIVAGVISLMLTVA